MSDISIHAEAYAGTSIDRACDKLCEVATRINCNLHCDFNGVELIVRPGDDPRLLEAAWSEELHSKRSPKITSAGRAALDKGQT